MPIHKGKDKDGCFYQWGKSGKKYHYSCDDEARGKEAKKRAIAQALAASRRAGSPPEL